MTTSPNSYSAAWFAHFHEGIPESRTAQEVAFVTWHCPLASFPRILDVCCGMGRHARALAELGSALAQAADLDLVEACSDFSSDVAPSPDKSKVQ